MRNKIILILLVIGCFNKTKAQDIGQDKFYHFYAGNFAAGIGSIIYCNSTTKPTLKGKIFISFGSALAVGLAKELYDINRTGFNVADLGATVLGAVPISIIFSLDKLDKNKKTKIKRKYKY